MSIIRGAVDEFVEYWNSHKIRKQRDRPNSVSGKPVVLYKYQPNITRYGYDANATLIAELEADFTDWGALFYFSPLYQECR
jgi:hypothetical protein